MSSNRTAESMSHPSMAQMKNMMNRTNNLAAVAAASSQQPL